MFHVEHLPRFDRQAQRQRANWNRKSDCGGVGGSEIVFNNLTQHQDLSITITLANTAIKQ